MVDKHLRYLSHPLRIQGNVIESDLPGTSIGEVCEIHQSLTEPVIAGYAQVIGFNNENTLLSLLNDNRGYSRNNVLVPTGRPFCIELGDGLKGKIINALGKICGGLDDVMASGGDIESVRHVNGDPRDFAHRKPISELLITGVRAIDGLLSCGRGQRMGIFASAGCGKTSLMNMIIEHSHADIYVIALIGERGREVTEMVEALRLSARRSQIIVVYSTSDRSCVERCNAAKIATTIAEYFADKGLHVLLFVDSVTRYARALRDLALSMGEMPARRGYPASVFEDLPKLLERPGCFQTGSITAFYSVLLESEDESDAIGDEVRSILDGHIYLSKKLAAKGHFPAIDILNSLSRVANQVTSREHQYRPPVFAITLFVRMRCNFSWTWASIRKG